MDNKIVVDVPLFVYLPRKTKEDKKVIINLNGYRNWHYLFNNEIKKAYKLGVSEKLKGLVLTPPISLHFKLFKKDKRLGDRSNVLSIHEKYFCDALVELGCLEDDNDKFIKETRYSSGGIDKDNPRVEVSIAT